MFSEWSQTRNEEGGRIRNYQASTRLGSTSIELSEYQRLPSGDEDLSPVNLLQGESSKLEVIADLDAFFERLYKYYCGKGLWCIATQWVVELLSLGFTIGFSGFFLLIVDWQIVHTCGVHAIEPCDLVAEAVKEHPLTPFTFLKAIIVTYLSLFSLYWVICFLRFFIQLREILEVRHFYHHRLCVSDRELQTSSWAALLDKIVKFQQQQRLCVIRDLSAHDVVMRIMRRENYLIGLINKGILAVPLPAWVPGSGPVAWHGESNGERRLLLTRTLEWSLNWCILQQMFDKNFLLRKDFIENPNGLRRRFQGLGFIMLLLSPFLVIFMFVYFFLRHAEEFYRYPSTARSRRWSILAKWIFREFNEMEHMFSQRVNCSYKHAVEYMNQFPSVILSLVAKFISFVAGGFAAILLIIAFLDESLLEAHIFGRNLFWFAAVFGTVTAISRSAIIEEFQVFEPEKSLRLVSCFTHYMPKHWRGAENKDSVRSEFETLFQYTGMALLEDLVSIFVTPYTLFFLLPKYVDDVLQFIQEFTVRIDGVGDVCSLSVFDFKQHGNQKYGSPFHTRKTKRSCQGKMEKSFLSFQSSYPNWEPDDNQKRFLSILSDFQVQNTKSQLMDATTSLQFFRPRLDNDMLSLLMQPGYGFKWPLSCGSSNTQDQVHSRQLREDLLLRGNMLAADQLYWLVDKYYTAHLGHVDSRQGTDIEDGYQHQDNNLHYASRMRQINAFGGRTYEGENIGKRTLEDVRVSEDTSYGHVLNTYSENALSFSSVPSENILTRGSSDIANELLSQKSTVLDDTSVYPKKDENHWWLQQRPSTSVIDPAGSFLEPPMFEARHFAGSSSESSVDGEERQERAWDLMNSRRAYTSSIIKEKGSALDLPFGDVYDVSQIDGRNENNFLDIS